MGLKNIYIIISQGNVYRDLIRLGMVRFLLDSHTDIRVILLTQAYAVREVLDEVNHPRLIVARHDLHTPNSLIGRLINQRIKQKNALISELLNRVEIYLTKEPPGLEALFQKYPPALVVSTHPRISWESDVIRYALKKNVLTLGVVKSWDNVLRRLISQTEYLAVWNRVNLEEATTVAHYRKDRVRMIGSCAFDRYFDPSVIRPHDEFISSLGLNPDKPVVLFGTAGSFAVDWDETFMMDLLLEMREQTPELKDVQFICRLHPITHLEYFWPYRKEPGVVLSFGSYVKTLGWCMTRDQVDEMANLLKHADLVITPASTLSIEAPIFDTPTIVTLFSTVRSDLHRKAIEKWWLSRHFKRIKENDWLPLADSAEMLKKMMMEALADPTWRRAGRESIVREYITFTDGKSKIRLADYIYELASGDHGRAV